jgi:hypothetical protein
LPYTQTYRFKAAVVRDPQDNQVRLKQMEQAISAGHPEFAPKPD